MLLLNCWLAFPAPADTATNAAAMRDLPLSEYLQLVLDHNESLQAQMLSSEASRLKARGEWGAFEPNLVSSITREANKRRNNIEQVAAQQTTFFSERNTIYDSGIESLIPTGAKIRLGYTLSDLVNNVNPNPLAFLSGQSNFPFIQQYQTFVGATVTQPLLKNGGTGVNLAGVRMAALESDIGFQEYRRQLMLVISQAEGAYWNLYFAQEQLRSLDQSVAVAETLQADARERLKAGQGSELDVLEAQSGLALRRTKRNTARQAFFEALGRVQMLHGAAPAQDGPMLHAVDVPQFTKAAPAYIDTFKLAFDLNPDYLIQLKKVDQQSLRLGVARNQVLPELNFKGAIGYNGIGKSPGESWDVAQSQDFPSWSVALELRLPLAGSIKGRNEFNAAKLELRETVLNLNAIQTQLANALNIAIQKTQTAMDSAQSYQTIVQFNEDMLKTQLARFNVGKVDGRKVLEVEAELFDARQSMAEALVQYERARLELELATGSILQERHLEITRDELRKQTHAMLHGRSVPQNSFKPVFIDGVVPLAN